MDITIDPKCKPSHIMPIVTLDGVLRGVEKRRIVPFIQAGAVWTLDAETHLVTGRYTTAYGRGRVCFQLLDVGAEAPPEASIGWTSDIAAGWADTLSGELLREQVEQAVHGGFPHVRVSDDWYASLKTCMRHADVDLWTLDRECGALVSGKIRIPFKRRAR